MMRRSSTVTARLDQVLRNMVIEMRRQHPEVPTQQDGASAPPKLDAPAAP
jgi:hypothetical protein